MIEKKKKNARKYSLDHHYADLLKLWIKECLHSVVFISEFAFTAKDIINSLTFFSERNCKFVIPVLTSVAFEPFVPI
jgi:hypothetical protein